GPLAGAEPRQPVATRLEHLLAPRLEAPRQVGDERERISCQHARGVVDGGTVHGQGGRHRPASSAAIPPCAPPTPSSPAPGPPPIPPTTWPSTTIGRPPFRFVTRSPDASASFRACSSGAWPVAARVVAAVTAF